MANPLRNCLILGVGGGGIHKMWGGSSCVFFEAFLQSSSSDGSFPKQGRRRVSLGQPAKGSRGQRRCPLSGPGPPPLPRFSAKPVSCPPSPAPLPSLAS